MSEYKALPRNIFHLTVYLNCNDEVINQSRRYSTKYGFYTVHISDVFLMTISKKLVRKELL